VVDSAAGAAKEEGSAADAAEDSVRTSLPARRWAKRGRR
jgi:hypothetical protein